MADEQRRLQDELDVLNKIVLELGVRVGTVERGRYGTDQVAELVDRVNELGARVSLLERALDRMWLAHLGNPEPCATGCVICALHHELDRGDARVQRALQGLGADATPPVGWEDRVQADVDRYNAPEAREARMRADARLAAELVATRKRDTIPGAPPAPPPAPADDDDHVDDSAGTSWSEPD